MTLPDAIRAAALAGCTGVTLWPSPQGWQAGVRQPDGGWRVGIHEDPIAALSEALRLPPEPKPYDGDLFE